MVDDTAHALPLGRQFYDDLFANGTQAAMVMFEQDFLCSHNTNTHLTNRDVDTGRLWLKAMDEAALSANISVQFCMMVWCILDCCYNSLHVYTSATPKALR